MKLPIAALIVFALLAVLLRAAPVSYVRGQAANPVVAPEPGAETSPWRKVIVHFKPGTSQTQRDAALQPVAAKIRQLARIQPRPARVRAAQVTANHAELSAVTLQDGVSFEQAALRLRKRPEVLLVEPDYKVQLFENIPPRPAGRLPDDFDFRKSWGLENIGQLEGLERSDISAPEAWSLTTGNRNVVVGVIDTGIDYLHPDLAGNMWINVKEITGNGIDDDGNGYVDDVRGFDLVSGDSDPFDDAGHGTHVAGIIGAHGNNSIGLAGVCWQVSLMGIKAFDEKGTADTSTVIEAMRYAVQNGADIINASWGQSEKSKALELAVAEAHAAGVLIVAAAGNEHTEAPSYPAACAHVVAVAATDSRDQVAMFSNYGSYVDLAAPGVNVYSTFPNNSYEFLNGTSMSAPHVVGVAALVLSLHPNFTNDQIENILRNCTDSLVLEKYVGTGRLNAFLAVQILEPLPAAELDLPAAVFGRIEFKGRAAGSTFGRYRLEYGRGAVPTNWTTIVTSSTPATNGILFEGFDSTALEEDEYAFRLVVENRNGQAASDRGVAAVRNVRIATPVSGDIIRAGEQFEITGNVWGRNRTYKLQHGRGFDPQTWEETGISSSTNGPVLNGLLAKWDTASVRPDEFYTLRLVASSPGKDDEIFHTYFVYLDSHLKPGWPVHLPVVGDFPVEDWRQVVVADLDQDGRKEVVVVDHSNVDGKPAALLVFGWDGKLRWQRELAVGPSYADIPVVGDVDGDGKSEIFTDIGNKLFGFHHDGSPLPGAWPIGLADGNLGKVVADLERDGKSELIAYSQGASDTRHLYIFDAAGRIIRDWLLSACVTEMDAPRIFPAVGNLDEDKELEIVAVASCQSIGMFDLKSTNGYPVWTAPIAGTAVSSPVIGDLDHDGKNEIVLAGAKRDKIAPGGLYVFDDKGRILTGFPILNEESFIVPPALGDLDGKGRLYISIPSPSSFKMHLIRPGGIEADGWPLQGIVSTVKSASVLGDIDGDGKVDVVLASPGYAALGLRTQNYDLMGGVKAWRLDGKEINLAQNGNFSALLMESSAGSWDKSSPAVLSDLDGDGVLDAIAMSIQDRTSTPSAIRGTLKNRSSIYAWNLGVPANPSLLPWPEFQQNAAHTGSVPQPVRTNQPPEIGEIPVQIIAPGGNFFPISLNQYVRDADQAFHELEVSITGGTVLRSVLSKNMLVVTATSNSWAGVEEFILRVKDPDGSVVSKTLRYMVQAGYVPPLVKDDSQETVEDVPTEIDVLQNDAGTIGKSLSILTFSKPVAGSVARGSGTSLTYTPKTHFHGTDTFTYTVTDGEGGLAIATVTIQVLAVNDPPLAVGDSVISTEDVPLTIPALANDTDPDQDAISVVRFTQPQSGQVTLRADQQFVYTPNPDQNGQDGFSYVIADRSGLTSTNTVNLLIKPVNDAPVSRNQEFALNRNASVTVTFLSDDPDKDELTYKVIKGPDHGELYAFPTVATYYPTNSFTGEDSFTYVANDGTTDGPVGTVILRVQARNNPPVAEPREVTTKLGQTIAIPLTVTDLDKDPVTLTLVSSPTHGTVHLSTNQAIYSPDPNYMGADHFQFNASDGQETSFAATINITVTDQNSAPEARDSLVRLKMNSATNLLLDVTDPEGDPLTYTILTNPLHGVLSGPITNLVFQPETNFVGFDRFTFLVNDGEFESKPATVTLMIRFPNSPPVAQDQFISINTNQTVQIDLDVIDPEGDPLVCPILKGPKNGLLISKGSHFIYRPKPGFSGSDTFTYKAWDGRTYGNEAKVTLTISSVPPVVAPRFLGIEHLPSGSTSIQLEVEPGRLVQIMGSTNLVDWKTITTQRSMNSVFTITDTNAAHSLRFYKAVAF